MRSLIEERPHKFCAKRIMGIAGIISVITAIFLGVEHPCIEPLLWVSGGLLGVTTFEKKQTNE